MSVRIWKVDRERVWAGLRRWLQEVIEPASEVREVWLFGSYARGEEGPGSDIDLLVIVREAPEPFFERAMRYTPLRSGLPLEQKRRPGIYPNSLDLWSGSRCVKAGGSGNVRAFHGRIPEGVSFPIA